MLEQIQNKQNKSFVIEIEELKLCSHVFAFSDMSCAMSMSEVTKLLFLICPMI